MVLGATPSAIAPDLEEKLNKLRRVKPDYIINCVEHIDSSKNLQDLCSRQKETGFLTFMC
ncbi:MAG: hypothetical protein RLZZ338_57 [Cyanobacteriota bacterium]|jgi:tRNA A37 threonylcarbamoyladenosine dehydratase